MLNVLLESRAPRPRGMRSAIASALAHGALIAAAVALTMPGPVKATGAPPRDPIWVDSWPRPLITAPTRRTGAPGKPVSDAPHFATIVAPPDLPISIPAIDVGPAVPSDDPVIGGRGVSTASPIGGSSALGSGGSAVDERLVDRAPRLLGHALEPSYPASLRDAGVQGRVVVQFVVDTLGRAELGDLQVIETPHPLFVEAVRSALARYRFSVGEAAGRKVRTRVQIPFEFTLTR